MMLLRMSSRVLLYIYSKKLTTAKEILGEINISQYMLYKIIKILLNLGIITRKKAGRNAVITFNQKHSGLCEDLLKISERNKNNI